MQRLIFVLRTYEINQYSIFLPICLYFIGTSATLRVGSPYVFFPEKIANLTTEVKNAITLKRLKVKT